MGLRGKTHLSTNHIGNISESAIITRFLELGYSIFIPYGRKQRYDLLVEDDEGQFWRVQCKTGRIEANGTIVAFETANHNMIWKDRSMRNYRGQCDYFAVYCGKLKRVYLLPVDQVGTTRAKLRLVSARNNQEKNVRWAKDYEL